MMHEKTIESIVVKEEKYRPPKDFQKKAHIKTLKAYRELYKHSTERSGKGCWIMILTKERYVGLQGARLMFALTVWTVIWIRGERTKQP
jgi:hypothetical protein